MERPLFHRRLIRVGFWLLIIYTALSTTLVWAIQLGFVPVSPRQTASADPAKMQESGVDLSRTAFAEEFAREYLFWTQGKEESRAERLKPFWKPGIDVQGGLDFQKADWNSYARNVDVWKVEVRKDRPDLADVTVFAETILTKVDDPKEQKRVDRYLVIPVEKAGDSYVVADIPRIVPPPVPSLPADDKGDKRVTGEPVDESVRADVEQFMRSFWKVYTTGDPQEIAYFLKNREPKPGLTGILGYRDLKDLSVQKTSAGYRAECNVLLDDLASGAQLTVHYSFVLVRDGERWYVDRMEQGEIGE
jgi:hypothetical protein